MPNKLKDQIQPKKEYNDRDWRSYDQALRNGGNLIIWFCEDAIKQWNEPAEKHRKKGRPKTYSDLSIQTCHVFRSLFKQALHQTEGLIISIIQLLDLDLKTPDHTTLEVASLVEQIDAPILEALGDGGYDHTATYAAIDKRHRQLNSSKTNLGLTFKF